MKPLFISPCYKDRVPWRVCILSLSLLVLLSFTYNAYSQDYYSGMRRSSGNEHLMRYLRLNEVKRNASKHFRDHFLSDGSEKWVKEQGSYIASFIESAVRNKVFYNSNGVFEYSVKYYGDESINKETKDAIQEKFGGYEIRFVMEITDLEKDIYFIKIANAYNIKTLKCFDGKIEVTESFVNAGI